MLIGSKAIKHWFPDFNREPKDTDYAVSGVTRSESGVEYLHNPFLSGWGIADPDTLYTLKISHCVGWNIKWDKHVFDIQFLKSKGCKLNWKLFHKLYGFWNTVHEKNKRSDLDMTGKEFFDNAIQTPHDYYHTILNPVPSYTKILADGAEVAVSEKKFDILSHNERCNIVREEIMVMAYERYKDKGYRLAYSVMLKKFIRNHAPLWEAVFILENYIELHKPLINYIKILDDGIETN